MITIQELYQIVKQKYPDAKLEGMTLSAEGSLDLRSLKLLPKGVTLSAGRSLYLRNLTTLPEGVTLSAGRSLCMGSLMTLPEGVTLSAGGYLNLGSLTTLPEGLTLSVGGFLYLGSLTTLPEGVTLSAGGYLNLGSLTTLPEGVTLSAGGYLNLGSLTTLPEGVTLSAGRFLDLGSLTTLQEGVSLSAGGTIYLGSLTTPNQLYKGQSIHLEFIDGSTVQRVSAPRVIDGCEVFRAAYFNGRGDGSRCYIARRGDYTAHGDSVAAAVRDVQFKELQVNFDSHQLVEKIKSCGIVTFIEYRLLTGACESGLRAGIKSAGLPEDTQELPLDRVLELCRGQYGGNRMIKLFS